MIHVGAKVRIYYDDDFFDEGEVVKIDNEIVTVDFYDWIEQWNNATFHEGYPWAYGADFYITKERGTKIEDFEI